MQNTISQKTWYFDTEKLVFQHLLEMSKEKFGKPIKYVQYLVMYDMKWRLRTVVPSGVDRGGEETVFGASSRYFARY